MISEEIEKFLFYTDINVTVNFVTLIIVEVVLTFVFLVTSILLRLGSPYFSLVALTHTIVTPGKNSELKYVTRWHNFISCPPYTAFRCHLCYLFLLSSLLSPLIPSLHTTVSLTQYVFT
jgi:hypothetical protein